MSISITFSNVSAAQAQALIKLAGGETDDKVSIATSKNKTKESFQKKTSTSETENASSLPADDTTKTTRKTKPLTYDDARKEAEKLAENYNLAAVISVLSKKEFDTSSVKEMDKKHYRAFISDCRKYKEG